MRSADRGKHGSGWEEGGRSKLTIRETAFLPQKLSARAAKMQIIEGRWGKDTGQPYLSCISFIHNRMPRHKIKAQLLTRYSSSESPPRTPAVAFLDPGDGSRHPSRVLEHQGRHQGVEAG